MNLAKTLFVIDREALNSIMRNGSSYAYTPTIGIRGDTSFDASPLKFLT